MTEQEMQLEVNYLRDEVKNINNEIKKTKERKEYLEKRLDFCITELERLKQEALSDESINYGNVMQINP